MRDIIWAITVGLLALTMIQMKNRLRRIEDRLNSAEMSLAAHVQRSER